MKPIFTKKFLFSPFLFLSLFLIYVFPSSMQAEILIEDTFSLQSNSSRTTGALLNSLPSEKGNAVWKGGKDTRFSDQGTIVSTEPTSPKASSIVGQVPVDLSNVSSGKIMVQADISVASAGWAGIGFQSKCDPYNWFKAENLVWIMLSPNGTWQLWSEGSSLSIAKGKIASFAASSQHVLALSYDISAGAVTAFIDGVDVSGSHPVKFTKGIVHSAGFNVLGVSIPGAAWVDNFKISTP